MQQPMPNPKDITDPTTAMNMIAQPSMNLGQDRHMQMVGGNGGINLDNMLGRMLEIKMGITPYRMSGIRLFRMQFRIRNGNGNVVAARAKGNGNGNNKNQIRCYNCKGLGHLARNYIIRPRKIDAAYLQTQFKHRHRALRLTKLPSMTQMDQPSVEQGGGTVEQNPATAEETHALYDSLYNNLAIKVEKVNTVNQEKKKLKSDFKIREDELLDKQIQLENKSGTLDPLPQKLENGNVELEFSVQNYEKENDDHKTVYKNLINPFKNSRKKSLVDITTKTRIPQLRSNTKNDRVPSASKSSRIKNKGVEVEEHPKNLLLSKNKKNMSSECNNVKLAIQNDKSKIVCVMCKQCLITANYDACVLNYVNGMNSHGKKQKENVSNIANQMKHKPHVKKPKKVGSKERLASSKPSKPRMCLRWLPTRRIFDLCGKIIESSDSEYLEVTFRRNTCFVRNLAGVDLLKRNRTTNLYTINLHDMASASPICVMARATSTKLWLWHQRLSHNNFDTINDLSRNDLITGLPKFKYYKEHLCPSSFGTHQQRLHLLYMDLCGPMRIASINGKWYVLVIVDDYSRYTWVHFLKSKDETPEVIKTFLKRIIALLQSPIIIVRTDNGSEFKNQVLKEYFDSVGISHRSSSVRTPQQNGVVERRNRTLFEAARTMLIFSRAPLFLWAEAIATTSYTQNRSIIY
ncbi:retrovirus-related pol polyprotein from transposon TNT 1-94 [Tanacetum coccineum]